MEVIVACMKASPTALYPQERVKILGQVMIRQQDMRTIVPRIIFQKFYHYHYERHKINEQVIKVYKNDSAEAMGTTNLYQHVSRKPSWRSRDPCP